LKKPSDVIRIRNATFYAYHGVLQEEQSVGGKFEVDIEMYGDFGAAARTDKLRQTVDYEQVYARIQDIVHAQKFYLIEALANAIGERLLQEFSILDRVTVCIRKPHPPVKGVVDYVEVEITQSR